MNGKLLYTVEQLAEVIMYHRESVRRAIRDGRIKAVTFGQDYRIHADEVNRIIANGIPLKTAVSKPKP